MVRERRVKNTKNSRLFQEKKNEKMNIGSIELLKIWRNLMNESIRILHY